ncbi:MAG: glycosyltransferase [Candidatus Hydrogenedentales bacterium]
MNLCVITSSFPAYPEDSSAAAGLFVRDFCLALAEQGHGVTLLTPDKLVARKEAPAGVDVVWFGWRGGEKPLSVLKPYAPRDMLAMGSFLRRGYKTLERLHRERRFDHVLAMWAVPAGVLAARLKRQKGVPFTTWCLGSDLWTYGRYPIFKGVVASVLRQSDLVYADGLALGEAAEKLSGRACTFLPSSRRINKDAAPPAILQGDGLQILFVGRYHRVKGVDVLLEAMAQFIARGGAGHLQAFGGGPEEAVLRRRAEQDDLRAHVSLHGFADETTYLSHLAACDVFVIPSRMESIPVVLSDAVQMGKPVIVTAVGDMGRLLRETPAGIVVPPEDANALADALLEMAKCDRSQFRGAVETLAAAFDIEQTAARWAAAAESTLSAAR